MRLSRSSPRFLGFVVTGRNHVWVIVAVVVFDGGRAAFFVGFEHEGWCGVGEQPDFDGVVEGAVAKSFASLRLITICTIV